MTHIRPIQILFRLRSIARFHVLRGGPWVCFVATLGRIVAVSRLKAIDSLHHFGEFVLKLNLVVLQRDLLFDFWCSSHFVITDSFFTWLAKMSGLTLLILAWNRLWRLESCNLRGNFGRVWLSKVHRVSHPWEVGRQSVRRVERFLRSLTPAKSVTCVQLAAVWK